MILADSWITGGCHLFLYIEGIFHIMGTTWTK